MQTGKEGKNCTYVTAPAYDKYKQEAHLLPTNWLTLVHAEAVLSRAALWWMTVIYWPVFFDFYLPLSHLPLLMREIPSSYRVHIWCEKTRMAGLQSGEGRIWLTQSFGHNTSTWQTHRETDSHVTIANAMPMHCVGRQTHSILKVLTWRMATSFLSCASCFVGNRNLSITLMATSPLSLLR